MDERLQKQLAFILRLIKRKISFDGHIYPVTEEMRMMQNTHGIWQSWHIFCRNIPMTRSIF